MEFVGIVNSLGTCKRIPSLVGRRMLLFLPLDTGANLLAPTLLRTVQAEDVIRLIGPAGI
jgi:hypothetical protein